MTKKKENSNLIKAKRALDKAEEKLIPLKIAYARELVNAEFRYMESKYGEDYLDYEFFVTDEEFCDPDLWEFEEAHKKGKKLNKKKFVSVSVYGIIIRDYSYHLDS